MCLPTKETDSVLSTICDSIGLNILNEDTILRGVGNELHLHSSKEATTVLNVRLRGKVHGIEKGFGSIAQNLVVFGEKEFVLLKWNQEHNNFYELYRAKLTDWISSAKFLEDEPGFVLLTAHSVLLHFSYAFEEGVNEKVKMVERISCADKSTLYCAHLHGTSLKDLIVFGGNAFGELLIWQPVKNNIENGKLIAPLLQRMTAHNGVIFSIDYEPKENLLITTSDDRSISFWHVINNGCIDKDGKPLAIGYGHQARVFQGRLIEYENTFFAITVGEDSHFCLWNCNGELIYKRRIQFGAVIWNFAYAKSTGTLYTVGSTGNIIPYNLKDVLDNRNKIPKKLAPPDTLNEAEYIAKIKYLTRWMAIGWTNRNRLVINDLKLDTWRDVAVFANFKCTALEVLGNLVAVCGFKRLTLLEHNDGTLRKIFDEEVLNGVIRSFHFLSETHFLMSDEIGNCVLLDKSQMHEPYYIELPKCKERWLTAALLVNEQFILVSNRLGNIMLYQLNVECNTFQLKHILKHPHGYIGATLLKINELSEHCAYVQSAGHDGTLKTLCVNLKEANITIANFQTIPIAWIEAAVHVDGTEVFLGFNDNHFIAWTEHHDTTLQVSCGGGHRCWHYHIYSDELNKNLRIKFMFIRNKTVLEYEMPLFNQIPRGIKLSERNRWHTKPCNALEIVECLDKKLMTISSGDDNLIKIASIEWDAKRAIVQQRAEIHTHISNIRTLKALEINANNYKLFSGGGRAQLCVTSLDFSNFKVKNLLNYTLKTSNNDLQTTKTHSFDPETRIMSLDVQVCASNAYNVFLACSDGYLRKLHIDNNLTVRLDKEVYYGKCLLQVRLVADSYVISTATDGVVSIYSLDLSTLHMKIPLQASGINALDVKYETVERKMHLLTGGDDQAVSYALIDLRNLNEPLMLEKLHFPQLHTAQVTAAKFSKCGRYLHTSGVDQNIVAFDLQQRKVVHVIHSCVADVKGLSLNSENEFYFIYGCGLQIFKISR